MPMIPDEVVKVLDTIILKSNSLSHLPHNVANEVEALSSAITQIQDYQKLKEEIDRLRVQLAGCGVAALGYATGKNAIEKGSYGYSASFQDVVDLWDKYQKLRENLPNEEELYKFIHNWLCKRHRIEYNGILARDLAHTIINKNGGEREGIRQDQSESETST